MPAPGADWPEGVARIVLSEVDSTSAEAARRAPEQATWILAHRQTAARGRRGRAWDCPIGNFAASLVWRPGDGPAAMALRSFVAALALRDALRGLGVTGLSLKWPNDVLLRERKLAGILLESPAPGLLILGIGVNLVHAPDPATLEARAVPPVSLPEVGGPTIAPEAFLDALAPAFAAREAQFRAAGFPAIRADWMADAARLGEEITARLPGETVTGRFADVDGEGCLILVTANGPRRIAAADIFFAEAPCS
ncbi:biotin--[acetyl-CoA-carboxylase] ligase [Jannaschia ovalis]|uniref:biotin--[biotin carboxyl-carrier protein] ligase n=1 Tax=Jannaschia ovalis TaxID=3038773 RepID=A0ABY8L8G9_9RHOB|nr:biotin--[acetyl-CoA-carboxylase] ligase [Jannaschia sp. GRR-S6-38]WGH77665.1 biotin--[acetyl-CoA-carboxylase] ligase [Jannaschia sp. GRR-S6-38]